MTGILLPSWKIALVISIKEPNKDAFQTTSYRPIALTSCVFKLMEKIINPCLVWYSETNGLFLFINLVSVKIVIPLILC